MANHVAATYIGVIGGCLFGFLLCITTGIVLETPWTVKELSNAETGIFKASLLIGATLGALTGGFISDAIGPRTTLGISGLIAFVCAGGLEAQNALWLFTLLRIVSGWSVGCVAIVGPLYVGENTNPKYRGIFGSVFQLSICVGILLSYTVNYAFVNFPEGSYAWRWELLCTGFFPLLLMLGYFFVPESAGYLQKREEKRAATHLDYSVNAEVADGKKGSVLDNVMEVLKAALSNKRAFIVGIMMAVFQQVTGVNIILLYGPQLIADISEDFKTNKVTLIIQIIIGAWNLISTLIAVGVVDVLGRRFLLITGFSLMLVGNILFGLSSLVHITKNYLLAFPGIGIFVLGFEMGPGPLFYVLTSELYPVEVRGRAMGIMGMLNWLANLLVVQFFPILAGAIGNGWVFIGLAVLCVVIIIFTIPVVPETKGTTLSGTVKKDSEDYRKISN